MANGIITPWNVACGSGIMTLNSPSGSTLQCNMWLWDDMPVNSPVAAPCNVAGGSGMACHGIRPNVRHVRILHLTSILTLSPQSTCHSAPVCEILSKSDHHQQKKIRHVDLQDGGSQPSWILGVQYWVRWKAHVRLPIGRQETWL